MRRLLLICAVVSFGCGHERGGGGGDCAKIVDHAIQIGLAEQGAGSSAEQRERLAAEVRGRRDEALEECEHRKPSKQNEQCALAAGTLAEMNACK